jgi:hypothetical protein
VLNIDVVRVDVEAWAGWRLSTLDAVVEGRELQLFVRADVPIPAKHEVVTRNVLMRRAGQVFASAEDVTLERDFVLLRGCPIEAEPAARATPGVVRAAVVGYVEGVLVQEAAI